MTLIYEGEQVELVCDGDGCKAAFGDVHHKDDVDVLLADSKAAGWRKHKSAKGNFNDSCPQCVRNWLQGGAKKSAAPSVNQGDLF